MAHTEYILQILLRYLTKDQWISQHYEEFKQACLRISQDSALYEELCHYVLSEFMLRPDAQTIVDSGGAFFYCLRMCTNSWKSVTSPFYRTYRQEWENVSEINAQTEEIPDEPEVDLEALAAIARQQLDQLGWYEKELFSAYVEHNGNASALSKSTQIPRTSINLTVRKVKTFIRTAIR